MSTLLRSNISNEKKNLKSNRVTLFTNDKKSYITECYETYTAITIIIIK